MRVGVADRHSAGEDVTIWGLDDLCDGRAKLYVTWRALQFRKAHAELFKAGEYLPAHVSGTHAAHVCAFARRLANEWIFVIIPCLYAQLLGEREELPLGAPPPDATCATIAEVGRILLTPASVS